MKLIRIVLGLALFTFCANFAACSLFANGANAPGLPPDASSAQVTADEALQALATAWNASATVCLDVEGQGKLKPGSCANVLLPARDALLVAAATIDTWSATGQGNFPCAVADVVSGLSQASYLFAGVGVNVPPAVQTGLDLAQGVAAFCQPKLVSSAAPGAPLPGADAGAGAGE